MMKRLMVAPLLMFALAACGEEEVAGPPTTTLHVRNNSSTEANVKVKRWTQDYQRVSSGKEGDITFVNETGKQNFQVHIKSRKKWDECWISAHQKFTIVVFDNGEKIGCKVETK